MARRLMVLALVVLLRGRITRSMTLDGTTGISAVNVTTPEDQKDVNVSTDLEIHNILIEVSNRIFRADDTALISLIKRGIQEAAKSSSEKTTGASIEAGAKKAQRFVTDVTAAYTQAIFRANSAQEAQEILQRFQDTIQRIVDYAKNGQFNS